MNANNGFSEILSLTWVLWRSFPDLFSFSDFFHLLLNLLILTLLILLIGTRHWLITHLSFFPVIVRIYLFSFIFHKQILASLFLNRMGSIGLYFQLIKKLSERIIWLTNKEISQFVIVIGNVLFQYTMTEYCRYFFFLLLSLKLAATAFRVMGQHN